MKLRRTDLIIGVCVALSAAAVPATAQQPAVDQGLTASTVSVYTPPACVPGVPFADVTCSTGFDPWIEQFGLDGITAGCGGGNYCPGAVVTRDQMAVFIEKAMRGTSNWPPHTVLVFHHPAAEVSSDLNSGAELLAMVAAIPTTGSEAPSAANPWLVKVGPGFFDLGSGSLALLPYTAIEGGGQDITVITATGYADGGHGTVIMGDHGRLSRLTVANSGGGAYEVAVDLPQSASEVTLDHATLTAANNSASTGTTFCLLGNYGSTFSLVDCELIASGALNNFGVEANGPAPGLTGVAARLEGVRVTVSGPSTGFNTGFSGTYAAPVITDSVFHVSDAPSQIGIMALSGGPLELRNSEVHTTAPGAAVEIGGISATIVGDTIVSQGYGIYVSAGFGSVEISNCRIEAFTDWLVSDPNITVTVGASKLVGTTTTGGGTVNCFGNYTATAFLPNTCP